MEDFSHRGKNVKFWSVTGEVIGTNKYSETHVSSSGGGGYVGQYGGHVSAPTIHSSTITNHEFWIKTEDGYEKDIKLRGVDIPLRAGQKITLISAGMKGEDTGWHCIFINHSAGKHWFINNEKGLNRKLELEVVTGKSVIFAIIIFVAMAWVSLTVTEDADSLLLAFVITGIFIAYRIFVKCFYTSKLNKSLKAYLEKLAQEAYQIT
jgi:hypothetical protein